MAEAFEPTREERPCPLPFTIWDLVWMVGGGIAAALLLFFVISFGYGAYYGSQGMTSNAVSMRFTQPTTLVVVLFAASLGFYAAVPLFAAWRLRRRRLSIADLLAWPGWPALGLAIVAAPVVIVFCGLVEQFVLPIDDRDRMMSLQWEGIPQQGAGFVLFVLLAIVAAPIAEEVLFRGVLIGVLARRIGLIAAVLASSFLFAGVHGLFGAIDDPVYWLANMQLFFIGLVAAWLYLRYRSLLPAILFHFTNNALAMAGYLAFRNLAGL